MNLYQHTIAGRITIVRAETPEEADKIARKRAGSAPGRILFGWVEEASVDKKTGIETPRGLRRRYLDPEAKGPESAIVRLDTEGAPEVLSTIVPRE